MWESVQKAWVGWQSFTDGGKLVAPALAAVAYMVMRKGRLGPAGRLVRYGGIAAVLCICPVTAALLMLYQTAFYDYPWIWSMVPLTALIALGGTVFLTDQWKKGGWGTFLYNTALTLLCVGVLMLCGGLGESRVDAAEQRRERVQAEAVLAEARAVCGEEFCLWAPREILEYARTRDGKINLLYGRDMWDAALHAYSYDVYSEETEALYLWMEHLSDYGAEGFGTKESAAEGRECVRRAFAMGVDVILLPEDVPGLDETEDKTEEEILQALLFGEDLEIIRLEGYFLLRMR
ncbi:MAG: hypothetical protein K2K10_01415 [Acetatifactor sp.]|nr:hypothetical protein [Acetatifactor sp.]